MADAPPLEATGCLDVALLSGPDVRRRGDRSPVAAVRRQLEPGGCRPRRLLPQPARDRGAIGAVAVRGATATPGPAGGGGQGLRRDHRDGGDLRVAADRRTAAPTAGEG